VKKPFQIIGVVVLCGVLLVGLYLGGWWLTRDTTDRSARVQQQTYGRQNALVEQILDDIEEAQDPNIPAVQRIAIVDIVCDSAAKLTGSIQLPPNAAAFITEECP
jgi:hypothetical protein